MGDGDNAVFVSNMQNLVPNVNLVVNLFVFLHAEEGLVEVENGGPKLHHTYIATSAPQR